MGKRRENLYLVRGVPYSRQAFVIAGSKRESVLVAQSARKNPRLIYGGLDPYSFPGDGGVDLIKLPPGYRLVKE